MKGDAKIAAIIVTFYPNEANLNNIAYIASQVTELFLFDNTPDDKREYPDTAVAQKKIKADFYDLQSRYNNVHLIFNGKNIGLPINYNMGLRSALDLGLEFLILFDQDSKINDRTIPQLLNEYFKHIQILKIGAIGSSNYDSETTDFKSKVILRSKGSSFYEDDELSEVLVKENSGLLLPISNFNIIGSFSESYFLDGLDYDLCMRLRLNGFRIFRSKKSLIIQSAGSILTRKFMGIEIKFHYRGPDRTYLIFKSYLTLLFSYWKRSFQFSLKIIYDLILIQIKIIFLYENKKVHLTNGLKGTIDALRSIKRLR